MDCTLPLILNKKLNIAYINLCTETEGPYKRMAIWFQGCNILCKGCCNPELQEIKIAHIMTIKEILELAAMAKENNGIEGVTFLGGEPTLQKELPSLAKELSKLGLGIILFTGRSYESLNEENKDFIDLIIDGKFEIDQIENNRNLIGSKNQKIIYITDRYKKCEHWFTRSREKQIEINVGESLFINGDVL